ncbi:replicative DNA helicase, partial [bacterium]
DNLIEKLTPSNIDAERAVIGSMLLDKEAVSKVLEMLFSESFYVPNHQVIFETIKELYVRNSPIDIVTVTDALQSKLILDDVGGYTYLLDLTESVPTTANVEQYAKIVEEKNIRRELIKASNEIIKEAYESSEDISLVLDKAEKNIFTIGQKRSTKDLIHIKDTLVSNFNNIAETYHDGSKIDVLRSGVSTGISSLDEVISGLNAPDLLIIAARPAMGKTAFCLNIATNVALKEKAPVAIFSLEMSRDQIAQRILSAEAGISSYHMKNGNISQDMWESLTDAVGRLYGMPIYIDDSGSLSPMEMRAKVRRLKAQHKKLGVVIVDYLQLMEGGGTDANRVQEISKVTRSLKRLAMEMQVPVIALSQLSRTVEQRQNKRPQLSDLRESGCLTGDTLILDPVTGERKPIVELVDKQDLKSFAIDDTLKLGVHNVSKVFYSGQKMVYEIKTRTGRKIKASANHPFLKISGWERLDALKIGDRIGLARNINIKPQTNTMSDDELILIAHLLGDGCILPSQPYHYTSADMNNINIVKDTAKRLFNIEARIEQQKNWFHAYLTSPYRLTHGKTHPITEWYKKLNIDRERSYNKIIPANVFKNDNEKISLFLRHLWATDGNISSIISKSNRKNSISIYYATSSEVMANQVQHLLLRLGIMSSLKPVKSSKGYRCMYHISVTGSQNQIKFLTEVGCYGMRGQNIENMVEELKEIKPNVNYDVIPKEAWKFIIEPAKYEAKIGWREVCEGLEMSYSGSTLFKNGISRERMSRIYKVIPQQKIKELSESDILWDEIISIAEIGIQDVYDATVPGPHNFVANDFIVHNSIEQDADIVMFIYRDEYYNHDSAKTKTAEIIIAKHRNGPTATVELYFDADLTKFSGLERFS